MNRVLLTGAGFTHNWGGWLGAEALEFLLGCGLSKANVNRLWRNQDSGGFEAALAKVQDNYRSGKGEAELRELQAAVRRMFVEMQKGLERGGAGRIGT